MKDLVEYIVRSLVDNPTQARVRQVRRGSVYHLEVHVNKQDMGRVIGKQGRVANAIRTLLNVAAAQQGKQVSLDIEEPR